MEFAQEHSAANWVKASGGKVPPISFWEGDYAIGRGHFKGGIHIGYVDKDRKGLVISWGGKEEILRDYEVLTGDKSYFHWVERSGTCNPQSFTPLKGGHEANKNEELYIAKMEHNGKIRIGKVGPDWQSMAYGLDGVEYAASNYFVLAIKNNSRQMDPLLEIN
ncbi:uncharacterized protein OCT59_009391 [Rhizophagus irregularis]|uniref:Uncharacterized protein n=2 Tax=Rhizophagus irregularis TaxID=588596 RepID=A0A015IST2_RHIIW|nr:hypothetical protein RirG_208180 [Rhizophagus irregularis DAOM 197198w]EXX69153.1 hypothetical protein RirG_098590 [Rhizophagus irregularis DAOM 197198w]UZO18070.1 hypothetical protein OCT59_009391 [Rhizophagus irregularis]GET59454.1 C3 and PZP-like alpha-2-macroglobulin domain-containing protein 8 isoform X2 [Rhizophagus irregularis DAOM 181602=DAOM 197198]CAG8541834.1 14539_t:CDS:2 [Rhizophagus irregularis]